MISKCTRDTVSSASTRSFSGALPMRITSPEITNSVPRCAPLITTSLQRRRLTVAGVASRRIRVPVKCSIGGIVARVTCELAEACCTLAAVLRTLGVIALTACGLLSSWGNVARAQPVPAKPSDAPLPSCLDQTLADQLGDQLKPRGVQKKDFLKRRKVNLVMHGGLYGGDLTSSSWIAGGALGFFFTEDFGISGEFNLTPLSLDLDEPLAQFFNDTRFEAGMAYVALGNLM